jgi:hypothetical protein
MTSTPTTTPADPRVLSGHRQAARGGLATALPKFLRRALAPLYGNPAAVTLHRQARFEADCLRTVRQALAKARQPDGVLTMDELRALRTARPADGGASTSLAQPVPYHALHGETGEGFETRRSRYDLPAGVTVILALGFLTPILAIVIIRNAS